MQISHVVTNGCSLTYCQGLESPSNNGWPAQLASKLNTNIVNLGLPSIGNDCIHRRTYEYVFKNLEISKITNSVPLFVIAWTQPWRREAWITGRLNGPYNRVVNEYVPIMFPREGRPTNAYEQLVLDDWNIEDHIRRTLIHKLSLKNLFENLGIPYIMTNYMEQYGTNDEKIYIEGKFPELITGIHSSSMVNNLHELTHDLPKLPCGHDGVIAQEMIATYMAQKIHEIYPDNVYHKTHEFLKLSTFIKGHSYPEKFPEWTKTEKISDIIH